jgi:transposase-like protein
VTADQLARVGLIDRSRESTSVGRTDARKTSISGVRAALRYVNTQDSNAVIADLKNVYWGATGVEAEQALEKFTHALDVKYPTIAKVWRAKWNDIVTRADFPAPIYKAIYTTNTIASIIFAILSC